MNFQDIITQEANQVCAFHEEQDLYMLIYISCQQIRPAQGDGHTQNMLDKAHNLIDNND